MLAMISRRGGRDSRVEHDVALGPGDEESRDVGRPNVVEVASYAERFGGPLSANLCRVQPPADEHQRNNAQDCQQDRQPTTLGEVQQHGSRIACRTPLSLDQP
jgi:hypothetical protein